MKLLEDSKKIIVDVILSIIGSFFITGISQLIIYPNLSKDLGQVEFGSLLTLMGLSNVIGVVFGNSLNNIRLLKNIKYLDKGLNGDFKYILKKIIILSVIIMILVSIIFKKQVNTIDSILLIIITILIIYRGYLNVYYRLDLKYNMILLQMIITGVGYIIGLILFKVIKSWPIVFLTGEVGCFILTYYTTGYKVEECKKTELYNETKREFIQLLTSNLVVNVLLYADRLLINPILGAANVTIYYVASIVGKVFGIVLQPISSVMLTYISKDKKINKRKLFTKMVIIIIICGVIGYILIIPITPVIIGVFYPDNLRSALIYTNIANLSVILMIMGSLIQPFTLKFCPMNWQTRIQCIYAIFYLISSIILMNSNGLFGFCIAAAISNFIRVVLFIVIGYVYSRKDDI